jgi:hypothetical protein
MLVARTERRRRTHSIRQSLALRWGNKSAKSREVNRFRAAAMQVFQSDAWSQVLCAAARPVQEQKGGHMSHWCHMSQGHLNRA